MAPVTEPRTDQKEATLPEIEGLPMIYLSYEHLDAVDLQFVLGSFDRIHETLRGPDGESRLRVQGVETRASIILAFLSAVAHYGPVVLKTLADVLTVPFLVYEIRKDRRELEGGSPPPEDRRSPEDPRDKLSAAQRQATTEVTREFAERLSETKHIPSWAVGDGNELISVSPHFDEYLAYAVYPRFERWLDTERPSPELRDSDIVTTWLETEGYESLKNHYDQYLAFNNLLRQKGFKITYIAGYQTFMDGYRLQVKRDSR